MNKVRKSISFSTFSSPSSSQIQRIKKKIRVQGENFFPHFLSLLFSFLNQIVENAIIHPIFFSLFSILIVFTPTKHTGYLDNCFLSNIVKNKYEVFQKVVRIWLKKKKKKKVPLSLSLSLSQFLLQQVSIIHLHIQFLSISKSKIC